MELLNTLQNRFPGQCEISQSGTYITLTANQCGLVIEFSAGIYSIYDNDGDNEVFLSFTNAENLLPFIVAVLYLEEPVPYTASSHHNQGRLHLYTSWIDFLNAKQCRHLVKKPSGLTQPETHAVRTRLTRISSQQQGGGVV